MLSLIDASSDVFGASMMLFRAMALLVSIRPTDFDEETNYRIAEMAMMISNQMISANCLLPRAQLCSYWRCRAQRKCKYR